MYSENILMTEKRTVCFQSKNVKITAILIPNNNEIYLRRYFEIFV